MTFAGASSTDPGLVQVRCSYTTAEWATCAARCGCVRGATHHEDRVDLWPCYRHARFHDMLNRVLVGALNRYQSAGILTRYVDRLPDNSTHSGITNPDPRSDCRPQRPALFALRRRTAAYH